jgi:hypothetical protein
VLRSAPRLADDKVSQQRYTAERKDPRCDLHPQSSEEGIEQEFNSLQAQRQAREAFINSQCHEGWVCLRAGYDDGGFSGATMDRDQPRWDAVQAQLADNATERNTGARNRRPSVLAGMLFDGDGNHMTPSHAVKKSTRYRYFVSRPLIAKDQTQGFAGLSARRSLAVAAAFEKTRFDQGLEPPRQNVRGDPEALLELVEARQPE